MCNEASTHAKSDDLERRLWPFPSPRVAGVSDHYNRSGWFLASASPNVPNPYRTWLLLAAVHSARACIELMFEACDKEEVYGMTRANLKEMIQPKLKHFDLIERIRIHDFHRFGVLSPDPNVRVSWMGGPVKLKGGKGAASLQATPSGPLKQETGNMRIIEQRPLYIEDGRIYDDESKAMLELHVIVGEFLQSLPPVIVRFQRMCDN